jgi:hypothetical protein
MPTRRPTSQDSIETLARLAAGRTTRTDRLEDAVNAFLAKLEPLVELGSPPICISGVLELFRHTYKSNVGSGDRWVLSRSVSAKGCTVWKVCCLDEPLGGERFLHGDFNCKLVGPTRDDLLCFALHAGEIVQGLILRQELENVACEKALVSLEEATEVVQS